MFDELGVSTDIHDQENAILYSHLEPPATKEREDLLPVHNHGCLSDPGWFRGPGGR